MASSDEARLRNRIGLTLYHNFVEICTPLILYGVYLCLFLYSIALFSRHRSKSRAMCYLIAATTTMFLAATINMAAAITLMVSLIQSALIRSEPPDQTTSKLGPVFQILFVTQNFIFIVADAVVIWRAWVLYAHSKLVRYTLLAAVSANTILFLVFIVIASVNYYVFTTEFTPSISNLSAASTYLSTVTNLLATVLIGWRFWRFREQMKIINAKRQSKPEKILVLLAETGIFLVIMQLINSILSHFPFVEGAPGDSAQSIIGEITIFSAAIIPTLIAIIVHAKDVSVIDQTVALGNGRRDDAQTEHAVSELTASTLRFASRQTESQVRIDSDVEADTPGVRGLKGVLT